LLLQKADCTFHKTFTEVKKGHYHHRQAIHLNTGLPGKSRWNPNLAVLASLKLLAYWKAISHYKKFSIGYKIKDKSQAFIYLFPGNQGSVVLGIGHRARQCCISRKVRLCHGFDLGLSFTVSLCKCYFLFQNHSNMALI